jgi:hypothetical protein
MFASGDTRLYRIPHTWWIAFIHTPTTHRHQDGTVWPTPVFW